MVLIKHRSGGPAISVVAPVLANSITEGMQAVTTLNIFLAILASELAYTSVSLVGSLALSFIVLWGIMALSPRQVFRHIEHDNNAAVSAVFFIISLLLSLAIGRAFSDPQTVGTLGEDLLWLLGGLLLASMYCVIVSSLILWLFSHDNQPKETPLAFLRREVQEDKNVGLTLLLGGFACSCFIPVIMITIG